MKKQKKKNRTVYYYRCADCGFSGKVIPIGYIGRCRCGSYNVICKKIGTIEIDDKSLYGGKTQKLQIKPLL